MAVTVTLDEGQKADSVRIIRELNRMRFCTASPKAASIHLLIAEGVITEIKLAGAPPATSGTGDMQGDEGTTATYPV